MDDAVLPPDETGGVSGVADGSAEKPVQDAAALQRLVWLYEQKFEIEKAIFGLLRKLAPDQ